MVLMDSFVWLISRECLKKKGDTVLVSCNPEDESFEIPSTIFGIPVRDLNLFGIEIWIIFASNTEICRVNMDTVWAEFVFQGAFRNDFVKQFCGSIFCNCIECSNEQIIIDLIPADTGTKKPTYGNIIEKFWKKIKTAFNESQSVERHCFHALGMTQVVMPVFRNCFLYYFWYPKRIESPRDNTEMTDRSDGFIIKSINYFTF